MARTLGSSRQSGRIGWHRRECLRGGAGRRDTQHIVGYQRLADARPGIGNGQRLTSALLEEISLDRVTTGCQLTGAGGFHRTMKTVIIDQERTIDVQVAAIVTAGIESIAAGRRDNYKPVK